LGHVEDVDDRRLDVEVDQVLDAPTRCLAEFLALHWGGLDLAEAVHAGFRQTHALGPSEAVRLERKSEAMLELTGFGTGVVLARLEARPFPGPRDHVR
jgi:hypothetical protein